MASLRNLRLTRKVRKLQGWSYEVYHGPCAMFYESYGLDNTKQRFQTSVDFWLDPQIGFT
jgi:hypothetical protein